AVVDICRIARLAQRYFLLRDDFDLDFFGRLIAPIDQLHLGLGQFVDVRDPLAGGGRRELDVLDGRIEGNAPFRGARRTIPGGVEDLDWRTVGVFERRGDAEYMAVGLGTGDREANPIAASPDDVRLDLRQREDACPLESSAAAAVAAGCSAAVVTGFAVAVASASTSPGVRLAAARCVRVDSRAHVRACDRVTNQRQKKQTAGSCHGWVPPKQRVCLGVSRRETAARGRFIITKLGARSIRVTFLARVTRLTPTKSETPRE